MLVNHKWQYWLRSVTMSMLTLWASQKQLSAPQEWKIQSSSLWVFRHREGWISDRWAGWLRHKMLFGLPGSSAVHELVRDKMERCYMRYRDSRRITACVLPNTVLRTCRNDDPGSLHFFSFVTSFLSCGSGALFSFPLTIALLVRLWCEPWGEWKGGADDMDV